MATPHIPAHQDQTYFLPSLSGPSKPHIDSIIEAWIRSVAIQNPEILPIAPSPLPSASGFKRKASPPPCCRLPKAMPHHGQRTPSPRKSARLQQQGFIADEQADLLFQTDTDQLTPKPNDSSERTPRPASSIVRSLQGGTSPTRVRRPSRPILRPQALPQSRDPYVEILGSQGPSVRPQEDSYIPPPSPTRSTSSTSVKSSQSQRSKTQVRRMADLKLSAKPILPQNFSTMAANLPQTVRPLYKSLRKISQGVGVIPQSVKRAVQSKISRQDGRPLAHNYYPPREMVGNGLDDQRRPVSDVAVRRELSNIAKISATARFWRSESVNEASWNAMVHCPLLELALHPVSVDDDRVDEDREDVDSDEDDDLDQVADKPDGVSASNTVSFWDMTTARPHTDFVPRNDCGDLLETKMVDFCLALSDSEVKSRALRTLKEYAVPRTKTYGSINHTEYAPLTLRPMSVSIESKTPEGSSDRALSQLSLWVACHFERLRSLRALKREREGLPLALEGYIPIALPLLMAMGPQWRLYFAVDTEDSIVIVDTITLGDTDQLLGCYQVVAALRELALWTETTFRAWMLENVLLD